MGFERESRFASQCHPEDWHRAGSDQSKKEQTSTFNNKLREIYPPVSSREDVFGRENWDPGSNRASYMQIKNCLERDNSSAPDSQVKGEIPEYGFVNGRPSQQSLFRGRSG